MDQTNRKTYAELYKTYPSPAADVAWVRETINRVGFAFAAEKEILLREDAKYFLLINFTEMIAYPLRDRIDHGRLMQALDHDLRLLLNSIAFKVRPKHEISGHAIIDALSKSWKEMDVMKLGLWG